MGFDTNTHLGLWPSSTETGPKSGDHSLLTLLATTPSTHYS